MRTLGWVEPVAEEAVVNPIKGIKNPMAGIITAFTEGQRVCLLKLGRPGSWLRRSSKES